MKSIYGNKYAPPSLDGSSGGMAPEQAKMLGILQAMGGGMAGPSMASGVMQTPPASLAGMLTGGGGAAGAAPAMGMAQKGLTGPGGMAMALPMQYLSGMANQADDAINAFTGMPTGVRKNPMAQIGKFLDQFTMHGAGGAPQGGGIQGPGSIGTMPHNEAMEPPGEADGLGDDNPMQRVLMPETEINLGPDDMDFSNDPRALAIRNRPMGQLAGGPPGNDFSSDPDALALGNRRFGDAGPMSGAKPPIGQPRPSMDFSDDPEALALSNPRFGDGGRMSGAGFMGRAPQDKDGLIQDMAGKGGGMDFTAEGMALGSDGPTRKYLDGSAAAQSSALDMIQAGKGALSGGTPGLAGMLKDAGKPPIGTGGGMRGGNQTFGSFTDEYAATGGGFGGATPGGMGRAQAHVGRQAAGRDYARSEGMPMPGAGTPHYGARPMMPPSQSTSAQSEYEKSKKRYVGGTGNF